MSGIVSSLLATAEQPIVLVQNRRLDKIYKLIERLEVAIGTDGDVESALDSLQKKKCCSVSLAFLNRLDTLQTARITARNSYASRVCDKSTALEDLLAERIALIKHNETFGLAFAAFELYLAATTRQPS